MLQTNPTPNPPPQPRPKPRRPTLAERQEREDYAYDLLSRFLHKSQIRAAFRKKFGNLGDNPIDRYVALARARIVAETGKTKDELRSESVAFYLTICRDPQAPHRDRILARERIDRLYGLDAPHKIAPTDPMGDNPYLGMTSEELIAAILIQVEAQDEVKQLEELYERDSDVRPQD